LIYKAAATHSRSHTKCLICPSKSQSPSRVPARPRFGYMVPGSPCHVKNPPTRHTTNTHPAQEDIASLLLNCRLGALGRKIQLIVTSPFPALHEFATVLGKETQRNAWPSYFQVSRSTTPTQTEPNMHIMRALDTRHHQGVERFSCQPTQ